MKSAIEKVIAELEESNKQNMHNYVCTGDEWFKGAAYGYLNASTKLKAVIADETSDTNRPDGDGQNDGGNGQEN